MFNLGIKGGWILLERVEIKCHRAGLIRRRAFLLIRVQRGRDIVALLEKQGVKIW